MHLENRNIDGLYGIKDRDRGVGVSCGVQQHRLGAHGLCLLQPIDQMPFMIGLTKVDRRTGCPCAVIKMSGNVIKRICAVNFRLSCSKQIEIWSIQNKDYRLIRQRTSPDIVKAAVANRIVPALYARR